MAQERLGCRRVERWDGEGKGVREREGCEGRGGVGGEGEGCGYFHQ